jgi:hypothetical protein
MLVAQEVDTRAVISRAFRLVGFVCCMLVVASFAMFARDQMAGASQHQQTELLPNAGAAVSSPAGPTKPHAQPRRFIDAAAKTLTTPFNAIIKSNNLWVKHGLPTLFALIGYGLGLGFLARYSAART